MKATWWRTNFLRWLSLLKILFGPLLYLALAFMFIWQICGVIECLICWFFNFLKRFFVCWYSFSCLRFFPLFFFSQIGFNEANMFWFFLFLERSFLVFHECLVLFQSKFAIFHTIIIISTFCENYHGFFYWWGVIFWTRSIALVPFKETTDVNDKH